MPGRSLADVARSRHLELRELVPVVERVAGALEALPAAGLVHRDVEPANILLADDGRAVLLDLGIVRSLDGAGQTTPLGGCPQPAAVRVAHRRCTQ